MSAYAITLSAGGLAAEMNSPSATGPRLICESLEGWWGTPEAKVALSEMASGDGAHRVADEAILYSARVVQMSVVADGRSRAEVDEVIGHVLALAHRTVTVEVDDGAVPTRARGYLEVSWEGEAWDSHQRGTVTVTCADPRRYGAPSRAFIYPNAAAAGGLQFAGDGGYLLLPVTFAGEAPSGTAGTVTNAGTSAAYPTITVSGQAHDIVITHPGGELSYPAPISTGAPLVLDSLIRTATVNGVDVTRGLLRRDFPVVPAGGSITLAATGSGSATITVECFDTYV